AVCQFQLIRLRRTLADATHKAAAFLSSLPRWSLVAYPGVDDHLSATPSVLSFYRISRVTNHDGWTGSTETGETAPGIIQGISGDRFRLEQMKMTAMTVAERLASQECCPLCVAMTSGLGDDFGRQRRTRSSVGVRRIT
ncbi:hypothetical protein THAOC_29664, partial [Thalassiosira oceanica]